jgi:hypothetical protein
MKKFAYATLAALGLVLFNGRLNAAVESDIVGYTTVEIQPGFNLLALPFNDLSSDEGVSIQDLVVGDIAAGSTIQYWDGVGLQILTYRVRGGVGSWYKGTTNASKQFYPGEGFWYNSTAQTPTTLTISGRVVEDETLSVAKNSFSLIGASVPKEMKLADVQFEGISNGATVQYWDGTELKILTYRVRNGVGNWYSGTKIADYTVLPAIGFWFNAGQTDVTIKF